MCALFFPAGAAILTVRNLERMGHLDGRRARELMIAAIGVFAVGFSLLIAIAPRGKDGLPLFDSGALTVLIVGVFAASFYAQRGPFRSWRVAHAQTRPASLLRALGTALLYELLVALVSVPVVTVAVAIASAGWGSPAS